MKVVTIFLFPWLIGVAGENEKEDKEVWAMYAYLTRRHGVEQPGAQQ